MSQKKNIAIFFGGVAPEHEVSVISGLLIVEKINRELFDPLPIYVSKKGVMYAMPQLTKREEFLTAKRIIVTFGVDEKGAYALFGSPLMKKTYLDCAYLAFHGGVGESGGFQGLCESLQLPYTSATIEGSAITMNKQLAKEVLSHYGVTIVPGMSFFAKDIKDDSEGCVTKVKNVLAYPVIVKPVHLGSSIGVKVAKDDIELEKALLAASYIDNEVIVEKFLDKMVEYNCAVRSIGGTIEFSEIEKPLGHDEILSFADKYQRGGGKKSGAKGSMASLDRELPAKISPELRNRIHEAARQTFIACRLKGMVRIDFMYTPDDTLYLTEINPIPGVLAFFLWEALGIQFKQQITDMIDQAQHDAITAKGRNFDYATDIIERFVKSR